MTDDQIQQWPNKPVDVSDGSFQEFVAKYPKVVVDCWAEWCGPCRMVAPVFEALAEKHQGDIVYAKLNTDHNPKTAMQHKIQGIPSFLIYHNGEFIDMVVGAYPKKQLEQKILSHF